MSTTASAEVEVPDLALKPEWVPILVEQITADIYHEGDAIREALSYQFVDLQADTKVLERLNQLLAQRSEIMGALKGRPVTAGTIAGVGPEAVGRALETIQSLSTASEIAEHARVLVEFENTVSAIVEAVPA